MAEPLPVDHEMTQCVRMAAQDCADRGLTAAAKWASELLMSVPKQKRRRQQSSPTSPVDSSGFHSIHASTPARPSRTSRPSISFAVSSTPFIPKSGDPHDSLGFDTDADIELDEEGAILAAQALLGTREYHRVITHLSGCRSAKAQFLRLYSRYLDGERKSLHTWYAAHGSRSQPAKPVNEVLSEIMEQLQNATDPWLLFLKGLVLLRTSRRDEAIEAIILSVGEYPWNWSAWELLANCVKDGEELAALMPLMPLPQNHPLMLLFQAHCLFQLSYPNLNEAYYCATLLGPDYFPNNLWIMTLRAKILFNLHEHAESEREFEKIRLLDPNRIEGLDIFSNILYLTGNKLKLSNLAHDLLAVDKDRPEVCCIVGNHYSLRGEHEKAIKYFRRATFLDHTFLAAWTLLGHEYVEQKNSHAAIEAYRRAIDVNKMDYRAWYGLGQAYELLNLLQYALHYFQRATTLRPYDVRLWQAQGNCFRELSRPREAIECYNHALTYSDQYDSSIHLKIADIYDVDLEEYAAAAAHHRRVVEISKAKGLSILHYAQSMYFVGQYQVRSEGGDWVLAHDYLSQVAHSNSEHVQDAADALKELERRMSAKASAMLGQMQPPDEGVLRGMSQVKQPAGIATQTPP